MSGSDQTLDKIHEKLGELDREIPRIEDRKAKLDHQLKELHDQRAKLIGTLQLLGIDHEVPAELRVEPPAGRAVRAIDAAVRVTQPGETVSKHDVAERVLEAGVALQSKNPAGALATAMARDERFERLGRGMFRRKEANCEEAPPPGNGNGASMVDSLLM